MAGKNIIIIGAGASGLAAACAAAGAGAAVTLIEKNHVPGRKILSTGAGKCNLSNRKITAANYRGGAPGFASKALKAMPPAKVLKFFDGLGLLLRAEPDGRLFPRSQKAADVVAVLVNRLEELGVKPSVLTCAGSVRKSPAGFEVDVRRVPPKWDRKAEPGPLTTLTADAVVLAAGGPAYPRIGGSPQGLAMARSLGHSLKDPEPVLAPLRIKERATAPLDGVRAEAALCLTSGSRVLGEERGEILFTDYGISGPPALSLSLAVPEALRAGPAACRADLFPEMGRSALCALLAKRRDSAPGRPWRNLLCGLGEERTMRLLSASLKLDPAAPAGSVDDGRLAEFAALLKGWELEVAGNQGFEDAMTSAGGVDTAQVDPATFGSKLAKGLFLTGEMLDLTGGSGGYNLHFAWTSGLLAGLAAAG